MTCTTYSVLTGVVKGRVVLGAFFIEVSESRSSKIDWLFSWSFP